MKNLDDMSLNELIEGRAEAVAALEQLEAEKVEQNKIREEKAIAFTREYIEANVDSKCKSLLLEMSDDLARKLIVLFDSVKQGKQA